METILLPKSVKDLRNLKISQALTYFGDYRKGKGLAQSTIRLDLQAMRAFIHIVGDLTVSRISASHVDDFFTVRSKVLSPHGLNGDLRGMRVFFRWALARNLHAGPNPVGLTTMWTIPKKEHFYLQPEEFGPLLDAARTPRDRMVCAMGLYAWQRQGEIGHVRIGDVKLNKRIELDDKGKPEELRGGTMGIIIPKRGGERDAVGIPAELYDELVTYLEYYRKEQRVDELHPDWYLVPQLTRGGWSPTPEDRIGKTAVRLRPQIRLCQSYQAPAYALRQLGYDFPRQGGHVLRRSGARAFYTQVLASGQHHHESAIRIIMAQLHHKSMDITEIYLGVDADRQRRNKLIDGRMMFNKPRGEEETMPSNVIDLGARRRKTS